MPLSTSGALGGNLSRPALPAPFPLPFPAVAFPWPLLPSLPLPFPPHRSARSADRGGPVPLEAPGLLLGVFAAELGGEPKKASLMRFRRSASSLAASRFACVCVFYFVWVCEEGDFL